MCVWLHMQLHNCASVHVGVSMLENLWSCTTQTECIMLLFCAICSSGTNVNYGARCHCNTARMHVCVQVSQAVHGGIIAVSEFAAPDYGNLLSRERRALWENHNQECVFVCVHICVFFSSVGKVLAQETDTIYPFLQHANPWSHLTLQTRAPNGFNNWKSLACFEESKRCQNGF